MAHKRYPERQCQKCDRWVKTDKPACPCGRKFNGLHLYRADFTYQGKRKRETLGHFLNAMAPSKAFDALLDSVSSGTYRSKAEKDAEKVPTANDLFARYSADMLTGKARMWRGAQLEVWGKRFGGLPLKDITPAMIAEGRDALREEGLQPATVNRYLAALSHALTFAVKEYYWLDSNPMSRVRKFEEPKGRARFLSREERSALLNACKADQNINLYPAVVLALATGMRHGEILGLKWKDVDLDRGWIILHDTKNKDRRGLPISGHALAMLREWSQVQAINGLVFPNKFGVNPATTRAGWHRVIKKTEIKDFRFHDLRHSAASELAMSGASLGEIADILGHRTLAMVKRYSHIADDHRAKVVEKMNQSVSWE